MAAMNENLYAYGGRDPAANILPAPMWVGIIRIFQGLFALITLALAAFAISAVAPWSGYGMNIFTSLVTFIFLAYIFVTGFSKYSLYNMWAQLALEIALVIFWLTSFALNAQIASLYGALDYYSGGTYYAYGYGYKNGSAGIAATKAIAALGAFTWVMFIVTLVMHSIALHRARMAGGIGTSAPVGTEHKMAPVTQPATDYNQGVPAQGYTQQQTYGQQPYNGQMA